MINHENNQTFNGAALRKAITMKVRQRTIYPVLPPVHDLDHYIEIAYNRLTELEVPLTLLCYKTTG